MQIESKYKLEKAVSSCETRTAIQNILVCEDSANCGKPVAVATNGRIMAIVPVIAEGGDLGLVSPEALQRARKATPKFLNPTLIMQNGDIKLMDESRLPRPKEQGDDGEHVFGTFPNWSVIRNDAVQQKTTLKIGLNPELLLDLARAIGHAKGGSIVLEITDELSPIRVTCKREGELGILMPMRVT